MKEKSFPSFVTLSRVLVFFISLSMNACVYKLDIQQGNIMDREKVAQLQLGMSKRQVRYLLGTPLVMDTFNQDRWDYFFSLKHYTPDNREGLFRQERLSLFFEKDQLSKIDNQLSVLPQEKTIDRDIEKLPEPPQEDHLDDK